MSEENIGDVKDVVINKGKLLAIIKENKARHDALFEAALSGYWISAKTVIEQKQKEFKEYLVTLKSDFTYGSNMILDKIAKQEKVDDYGSIPLNNSYFNYGVNLKYPESHEAEYNRAIRAIELNIYENIELSEIEFNQYVMNDWSWKNSFVTSNSNYISLGAKCITGYYSNMIYCSGAGIL